MGIFRGRKGLLECKGILVYRVRKVIRGLSAHREIQELRVRKVNPERKDHLDYAVLQEQQ